MKKTNRFKTILSCAACKGSRWILRRSGRGGGTAVPGIVAMKLNKDILSSVSEGMEIIVVTGTNGKTTTCNMIEHALTDAGCDTLLNKSGANMLHGIAADLICNTTAGGRPKQKYAVLECDEAALKLLVPYIRPRVIVVTNLFSDQVDRYGGVENTLKEIRTGVQRSPQSVLVLNTDEPLSASLGLDVPNKVIRYGLAKSVGVQGDVDLADAGCCPVCGGPYTYDYHIYAHLGGYFCPACGYRRPEPDVSILSVDKITPAGSTIHLQAGQTKPREAFISLPAVYNVYNAAAAVGAVMAMNLDTAKGIDSLASVRSSFGRLETFDLGGNTLQMILVKNPAGCNQAFSYLTGFDSEYSAVLCLNNRTGDGHDISWIEATDYEKLASDPHLNNIYVGGDCAEQLRQRLEKAGISAGRMQMVTDYDALTQKLKKETCPVFLLPNYTAMMELRTALSKETGNKGFWE